MWHRYLPTFPLRAKCTTIIKACVVAERQGAPLDPQPRNPRRWRPRCESPYKNLRAHRMEPAVEPSGFLYGSQRCAAARGRRRDGLALPDGGDLEQPQPRTGGCSGHATGAKNPTKNSAHIACNLNFRGFGCCMVVLRPSHDVLPRRDSHSGPSRMVRPTPALSILTSHSTMHVPAEFSRKDLVLPYVFESMGNF